jgi:hypothetical protein
MRKLAIALGVTAAGVFAGSLAWKAGATTLSSGAIQLPSAQRTIRPSKRLVAGCGAGVVGAGIRSAVRWGAGAFPANLMPLAA